MATNRASGPLILSSDSPAYSMYEAEINGVIDEASRLNLLQEEFAGQILTETGGIVCDRPHGDNNQSVAKSYFGLSILCDKRGYRLSVQVRAVLFKVLALHYCIGEVQQNPSAEPPTMAEYTAAIEYVHALAIRTKVRSLTANLFDPGSLKSAIQKNPYDYTDPEVQAYLLQLSRLLAKQPKHLHALTTPIVWNKAYQFGLDCIQAAADSSNQNITDLCKANIYQLDTTIEASFYLQRHNEVVQLCTDVGLDIVAKEPRAIRFLVDAANETASYDALETLCTTYATFVQAHMQDNWHTKNAVFKAAENVGWNMYGDARSQAAWDMLCTLLPTDFTADPKSPFVNLYKTLQKEVIRKK